MSLFWLWLVPDRVIVAIVVARELARGALRDVLRILLAMVLMAVAGGCLHVPAHFASRLISYDEDGRITQVCEYYSACSTAIDGARVCRVERVCSPGEAQR